MTGNSVGVQVSSNPSPNIEIHVGSPMQVRVSAPSPPGPVGPVGPSAPDPRVGEMAELTTECKDSVVEAINELNMPGMSLVGLYNNAKAG